MLTLEKLKRLPRKELVEEIDKLNNHIDCLEETLKPFAEAYKEIKDSGWFVTPTIFITNDMGHGLFNARFEYFEKAYNLLKNTSKVLDGKKT